MMLLLFMIQTGEISKFPQVDKTSTSQLMVSWVDEMKVKVLLNGAIKSFPLRKSYAGSFLMSDRKTAMLYGNEDVSKVGLLDIQSGTYRELNLIDGEGRALRASKDGMSLSYVACEGASPNIAWIWFSDTLELYKIDLKTGRLARHLRPEDFTRKLRSRAHASVICEVKGIALAPDGNKIALSVPGHDATSFSEPHIRRPETIVYDFRNGKTESWGPGAPIGWLAASKILSFRVVGVQSRGYYLSAATIRRAPVKENCIPFAVGKNGDIASLTINSIISKPFNKVNITDSNFRIKSVHKLSESVASYWVGSKVSGILD